MLNTDKVRNIILMSKRNTQLARNFYIKIFGEIPRDSQGRKYEIHHLDGDPNNNKIDNLTAISIEDHFNLHFTQGDWGSCYAIAIRMKKTPEEISELARLNAFKRIEEGTHPWKDSKKQREVQKKRIDLGTHQFLNSEFQSEMSRRSNKKQLDNGTHPFLNGARTQKIQKALIESGKHNFKNKEWQKQRCQKALLSGKHNFLGPNSPTQVEWTCPNCHKKGKNKGMFTRWHGSNCRNIKAF